MERIPQYMIPAVFMRLEEMPLTPNGKLDRQALPEPQSCLEEQSEQSGPQSPVEELMMGIWAEVLGREQIGREQNFFELGGHSLSAAQVVARITESLHVTLALRELFERPTL